MQKIILGKLLVRAVFVAGTMISVSNAAHAQCVRVDHTNLWECPMPVPDGTEVMKRVPEHTYKAWLKAHTDKK